jgi:alpha-amylase
MIEAEEELRRLHNLSGVQIRTADYDADGHEEILVTTDRFSAVLKPNRGGSLVELSLLKEHFNLTDTLSRRKEGYHLKLDKAVTEESGDGTPSIHDLVLAKEPGLKSFLIEDWYLKRCAIDHILSEGVGYEQFKSGAFGEDGDYVAEAYRVQRAPDAQSVILTRDGQVRRSGQTMPLRITKQFRFDGDSNCIEIQYELSSPHGTAAEVTFAVENNFNFQAGHAYDRYLLVDNQRSDNAWLDAAACHANACGVAMVDEYRNLAVAVVSDREAELWHLPIFTVSLSEAGFERVYQGTTLVHVYRVNLSDSPVRLTLALHAGPMARTLREAFAASSVSAQ